MANETTYTVTPGYGMTWICPSLSSDESVWTRDIAFAEKQLAANGCKVWCIHLPYGIDDRRAQPRSLRRGRRPCRLGGLLHAGDPRPSHP